MSAHALLGLCHPVNHLFQVAEVAHAEALSRAQGEHGHQCAGAPHWRQREESLRQVVDNHLPVGQVGQLHRAVIAVFPYDVARGVVLGEEFEVYQAVGQLSGIDVGQPFVDVVLGHAYGFAVVPLAHSHLAACYVEGHALRELRGAHLQAHCLGKGSDARLLYLLANYAVGDGRCVEIRVLGDVNPVVVDVVDLPVLAGSLEPVGHYSPLAALLASAILYAVEIVNGRSRAYNATHLAIPMHTVYSLHPILGDLGGSILLLAHNVEYQILSVYGLVLDMKVQVHI